MLIEKEVGDIEHCKAHKFQPTNTFSIHILMSRLFFIWMQIYVLFKYRIMCLPLILSFHLTIYCGHLFPLTNITHSVFLPPRYTMNYLYHNMVNPSPSGKQLGDFPFLVVKEL